VDLPAQWGQAVLGGDGPPWAARGNPVSIDPVRDPTFELGTGWFRAFVIGRRSGVPDATTADVWSGTALTRPLPLASKAMSIVSTVAGDALGVGGAQRVVVTFIDENGDWRVSDRLAVNGLTPVPITYKLTTPLVTTGIAAPTNPDGTSIAASIFRVMNKTVVDAPGATEAVPRVSNIGSIRTVDTDTGLVEYDVIPPTLGRSHSCFVHAPRGFELKLHKANTFVNRPGGAARAAFDVVTNAGPGTPFQRLALSSAVDSMMIFTNDPAVTAIPPRAG
jgi:hypothetical protein